MSPTPLSFDDERPGGEGTWRAEDRSRRNDGAVRPFLWTMLGGSLAGTAFAGVSTSDFISHLDRQVHSIHCSFIPGIGAELGENGCRTVMMSPYSSLFREWLWGGIPISLLAVGVFAYLVMKSGALLLSRGTTKRETLFLVAATLLPVLMSGIYGTIALTQIGALCKLCVGIYLSSAVAFTGAVLAHRQAAPVHSVDSPTEVYARWFGEGVFYVAVLVVFYVVFAPSSAKNVNGCGTLAQKSDPAGIFIPMGSGKGTPSIAVLDPLCPACKAFDERLRASGLYKRLDLNSVLFPLDSTCNWMVKESLHPGACVMSEAMLCDRDGAEEILDYAFAHQEELRDLARTDETQLRKRLEQQFTRLKGCLGSAQVKNKLNKSLRWAVANALPVLTPQLFVGEQRVCDEDTDLGLEYTVSRMLNRGPPSARKER